MAILYPMFALFFLTAFVLFRLGGLRYKAVAAKQVDGRYYKAYQGSEEPESLAVVSRHLTNLLEAPVLFYITLVVIFITGITDFSLLSLAWIYVACRFWHSAVHLSSNKVIWRFRAFIISWLVLLVLWVVTLINMIFQG